MTVAIAARRVLRAAGGTDVGRLRRANEDRFHVDPSRGIFIVVDGIGGHAAGDRAADLALDTIRERLERQTGPLPDRIREAITIANNEIYRVAAARPEWYGMACVLTVAVVEGDRAIVGHVGDSRLYRIRGDRIEKITPDHSPVGEREDAGELSEHEAMRHPRRNEVNRDVGSEPRGPTDEAFVFVADVELPRDAALLICSDGLTDQVPAETIRQIVRSVAGSPDAVVHALIDAANDAGGKDNVTVVFVQAEQFVQLASASAQANRPGVEHGSRSRSPILIGLVVAALAGFALGYVWDRVGRRRDVTTVTAPGSPVVVVRPDQSVGAAVAAAAPGTTIVVEAGEYREQLRLRDGVRVVSRVSRGATLRLPERAAEGDAGVLAADLTDAELSGFRIVGDAATPLGIGVLVRNASVRLSDLEITGAATAALQIGPGDGTVTGSDIRDNPGSALVLTAGSRARFTHNVFARNGAAEQSRAAFVLDSNGHVTWLSNVFQDVSPASLSAMAGAERTALEQNNWFIGARPTPRAPVPSRRPRPR